MNHYILVGKEPVLEPDLIKWGHWFGNNPVENRRVAHTRLASCSVSTVFLGLDHRFGGDGPPLLFETMVFLCEGEVSEYADYVEKRYSTWAEAEAGHWVTVLMAELTMTTRRYRARLDEAAAPPLKYTTIEGVTEILF